MEKKLYPEDVIKMPLAEFESRFGFRPFDALEKMWFAVNATRISNLQREAIAAGVIESGDLSQVVME